MTRDVGEVGVHGLGGGHIGLLGGRDDFDWPRGGPSAMGRRSNVLWLVGGAAVLALVVVIAVVMNRSEDKPTYDSDFFPEGNNPERDYPYIDTIQQWSVPYTDPYQIVAMGRKACQLLGQLPDTEVVEATMHEHAPNYTDDQIRRIVRPPTATYAEIACCGCELEAADSDS